MELTTAFVVLLGLVPGVLLGLVVGVLWQRASASSGSDSAHRVDSARDAELSRAADQAVIRDGLARLTEQLHALDQEQAERQGELRAQVVQMQRTSEELRRETASLTTALRKPQVRGQWGELHLRRAVELAGLVDQCDFAEQFQMADGAQRPDLVVHLAGGKQVLVDAKVPLDAFLDAHDSTDETARGDHLARHARQLRTHVNQLSGKAYQKTLTETPEFVVMFIPAEAFLSVALDIEKDLLEYAAARNVILATPTTLIALLRTVAHGWRHESLGAHVAEVTALGVELHTRLATMSDHFQRVGRGLTNAVKAYNDAVGSLEGRVMVSARRFHDLGVSDAPLKELSQVEVTTRSVTSSELAARRPA